MLTSTIFLQTNISQRKGKMLHHLMITIYKQPTVSWNQFRKFRRDEFTVFGEHIAHRLRSISNTYTHLVAQHQINNIIFETEIARFQPSPLDCASGITAATSVSKLSLHHEALLHTAAHRLLDIRAQATVNKGMNSQILLRMYSVIFQICTNIYHCKLFYWIILKCITFFSVSGMAFCPHQMQSELSCDSVTITLVVEKVSLLNFRILSRGGVLIIYLPTLWLHSPWRTLAASHVGVFLHFVVLLGRVISPSQGLYLHRTTHHWKMQTNIHALSRIWTHDPSVWVIKAPCPRLHSQCDQWCIHCCCKFLNN
jgi:hypothetical protein